MNKDIKVILLRLLHLLITAMFALLIGYNAATFVIYNGVNQYVAFVGAVIVSLVFNNFVGKALGTFNE